MSPKTKNIFKIDVLRGMLKQKTLSKLLLLLILSIIIGYLLSPRIIFSPLVYEEGDIIRQTIIIEEDLLIPDRVSTRLKRENHLKEQAFIYDFDPNILDRTLNLLSKAFNLTRQDLENYQKANFDLEKKSRDLGKSHFSAVQEIQDVNKKNILYNQYSAIIQGRLNKLKGNQKLSTKGFERKKIFDLNLNLVTKIIEENTKVKKYFENEIKNMKEEIKNNKKQNRFEKKIIEKKKSDTIRNFFKQMLIDLEEQKIKDLDFNMVSEEIELNLINLLSNILKRKIVVSKNQLEKSTDLNIEVRNLLNGESTKVENLSDFYDINEMNILSEEIALDYFPDDETGKKRNFVVLLAKKLLSPTITENKLEYEQRKEKLISEMSKIYFSVKKGEIIARAGDRATKHQVELISSYYDVVSDMDKIPRMIGIILIVFTSLILVYISFQLKTYAFNLSFKDLLLIGITIVITMILVKTSAQIGEMIEARYIEIQSEMYHYIFPVVLSSMLVGILINYEAALMAGLLTSLFVTIMLQGNLYYFFFSMMGCIVAGLPITKFESRYSILYHGLKISMINLPVMIIVILIEKNQVISIGLSNIGSALISGVLAAIIASILLPFFETIFDITTNLKLLELSNMNHPALKELIFNAPGTYQHSIVVGNLAESGAVAINANSILARVAAYYHDLGKGVESKYFIENQPHNAKNVHDDMEPLESAKVIIDHLKKGAELADKYRLGTAIKDILVQHHGTSLVKYFYCKSKNDEEKNNKNSNINEQEFRYLGPKPQSLESALIMIADAAEASTRSLNNPSANSIVEMVNKVGWCILEDGQLDDSGLTLQQFKTIIDVYCKVLININHQRIKYPEENSSSQKELEIKSQEIEKN